MQQAQWPFLLKPQGALYPCIGRIQGRCRADRTTARKESSGRTLCAQPYDDVRFFEDIRRANDTIENKHQSIPVTD